MEPSFLCFLFSIYSTEHWFSLLQFINTFEIMFRLRWGDKNNTTTQILWGRFHSVKIPEIAYNYGCNEIVNFSDEVKSLQNCPRVLDLVISVMV